jgi:hypothetical protein
MEVDRVLNVLTNLKESNQIWTVHIQDWQFNRPFNKAVQHCYDNSSRNTNILEIKFSYEIPKDSETNR